MTESQQEALTRMRDLRAKFRQTHEIGMHALKAHDFATLDAAIAAEADLLVNGGNASASSVLMRRFC